jgi:hypothetical protein
MLTNWCLSAKVHVSLSLGNAQECDSPEWPSAESAIHAFSEQLAVFEHPAVNRAFSAEVF